MLSELNTACSPPHYCTADEKNSIQELNQFYAMRDSIKPDTTLEEFLLGNKVISSALKGVMALYGRVTTATGEVAGAASKPLQMDSGKFDYLFGRVKSGQHNTSRSQQLQSELSQIGIYDMPNGRAILIDHFSEVASNSSSAIRSYSEIRNGVVQYFSVRESLILGPGGFTRLETTFETMANGTNRFITTIPIPVPKK